MKRILVVAPPHRLDFFDYLIKHSKESITWEFIWDYHKTKYKTDGTVLQSTKFHFWNAFLTPGKLIKAINPDKILFFEIIDLWQIPLILAAKRMKIPTVFCEHGVGNSVEMVEARFVEDKSFFAKLIHYCKKLRHSLKPALHNKIYFYSELFTTNSVSSFLSYFVLPFKFFFYTPIECLSHSKFPERTPGYALLFNRNNVEPFRVYNKIADDQIKLLGVPQYDKYLSGEIKDHNYLVFIEHPYLEQGILQWDDFHHEKIARQLEEFAKESATLIYIKLHPRSNIENWRRYALDDNFIKILQFEDITELLLKSKLILGFSSTLIGVMIQCKKNVVLLGWNPDPAISGEDYSKWGLCHKSLNIDDLRHKFKYWTNNNPALNSIKNYNEFVMEYNFPPDGNAIKRHLEFLRN